MNAQLLSHSRIARRHDPETSHLAAAEITQSGKRATQQEIVRNIVRAAPGLTSAEVSGHARHFGPLIDRYSAARRLPELEAAGFVRNGEKRRCKVTGRLALTWWPA